mgnify:CR=1 FL=1
MRSEEFRQASDLDLLPKSDRLLRAAVSGYCSLTRPTSRDANQLDDLALPLLPLVSEESKRYAAAALSETSPVPPGLLRRLADCPVSISAPLLLRSPALTDIDLIGLIGRHGLAHARAIARRPRLNPNIAALIRALGIATEVELSDEAAREAIEQSRADVTPAKADTAKPRGAAEEEVRERLREMMRNAEAPTPEASGSDPIDWNAARAAYPRMISTGLTGNAALFHTAIADAFDMSFDGARDMVERFEGERLSIALKAAGLSTAEAFFVAALAFPPRFATTTAIRSFVEDYRALDVEEARDEVTGWREAAPRVRVVRFAAANSDAALPAQRQLLKAS